MKADPIFENPRLVAIYDLFDGPRKDLEHYLAIAKELGAKSVLDVGCGTGCLAGLLSENGFEVTGVDPARASIDFARKKPFANQVQWIVGDAQCLPARSGDLAFMTGNVAQVFLTDECWEATLSGIHRSLLPQRHLVFEVRNPAQKAWVDWTREKTYQRMHGPDGFPIESWCEVLDVSSETVKFRWTYVFGSDGATLTSDSMLRFRERDAIVSSLNRTGYVVREIREAPDRPGKEFVFIAAR